ATLLSAAYLCIIFGAIVLAASLKITSNKNENEDENKISENSIIYIIFGMIMGLASGLVGIGGGLILVPLLILLLKFPMRKAVGLSSAAIAFTSAGGVCGYIINSIGVVSPIPYSFGYINPVFWIALVIPGVIFSRFGATLSHKTDPKKIRLIFSIVAFLIGSFMIFKGATLWMA
ncbi:MAG: sulfite exporter TauE/SafE family protein, partial [Methanimicrococcus sp.]|nr:sulfite exporter TauE/SafE family protein [Methanimicrococcus sp.]